MNTEITDNNVSSRNGWVLYDADCALCVGWARRTERMLRKRGLALAPLQSSWLKERLNVQGDERFGEMRLLLMDGRSSGGAEALVEISRLIWWAQPLVWISKFPGALALLRRAYRWVADRRGCGSAICGVHRRASGGLAHLGDYVPMLLLAAGVLWFRTLMAGWILMWALAFALYFGCKWLTWRRVCRRLPAPTLLRSASYLFFWPGMDATAFFEPPGEIPNPNVETSNKAQLTNSRTHRLFAWIWALAKTLSGIGLFCLAANQTLVVAPLVRGWLGMIGVVLFLHFGIFELLALWWRRAGVPVESLMRSPWRATSLAEFWGKRWNTAFHILAHEFAFKPLARQWGAGTGTLGVFFISGLIHDAVISLPARAGFGLPTAYFLAQAAGVLLVERSRWGRLIGLGRGVPGWLFTMVCTAAPAFWLFHPQFVLNVIVPMLNAVATK